MPEPSIWVLCGVRMGDTAQALELARQVGGSVTPQRLGFTSLHQLPNWLLGNTIRHLDAKSRALLVPPWPDLIIATGKRTAPVSAWIKEQSGGKAVIVQLGRPRMALRHFDLIVTTPQYGLPDLSNVARIALPFAMPKSVPDSVLRHWKERWQGLPRPLIAAAIGASKFPLRLEAAQLDEFATALSALARREGGSALLFSSPRSDRGAVARVRSRIEGPCWIQDGEGVGNPYQAGLTLADVFVVTGDSVSMASEMIATGKLTYIYPLPRWPTVRWKADHGLVGKLAGRGILNPPRDVSGFVDGLIGAGLAADLRAPGTARPVKVRAADHEAVVAKIRSLMASRLNERPGSTG